MRFRTKHRARKSFLGGLFTLNFSNFRLSSITNKLGPFSRNSRHPDRVRVDLPFGFHGELDMRSEEEAAPRRRRRPRS